MDLTAWAICSVIIHWLVFTGCIAEGTGTMLGGSYAQQRGYEDLAYRLKFQLEVGYHNHFYLMARSYFRHTALTVPLFLINLLWALPDARSKDEKVTFVLAMNWIFISLLCLMCVMLIYGRIFSVSQNKYWEITRFERRSDNEGVTYDMSFLYIYPRTIETRPPEVEPPTHEEV